ncbi:glycosyltransferase [Lactiplantibacillus plantarum]|uniref:glycosyltransferase n=1 Tax=Lactiplantibacillus plantarum TaxID=1590 RepID=UPI000C7F3791|nr:glycosyltransferase [Lactiplantibacillus plantarum]
MADEIIVIVVTYNPNIKILRNSIIEVLGPNLKMKLVDNNSKNEIKEELLRIKHDFSNVDVNLLDENLGIGNAQNIVLSELKKEHYADSTTLCFFDQDSYLSYGDILRLKSQFESQRKKRNIAALGANLSNEKGSGIDYVDEIISSGSISNLCFFNECHVGNFMGELFIDFIDYEWCWRAKQKGYEVAIDRSIILHHQLGGELKRRFGKQLTPTDRLYYVFRNLIVSLKVTDASLAKKAVWAFRASKTLIFQLTLADHRIESGKRMLLGIRDGLKYKKSVEKIGGNTIL